MRTSERLSLHVFGKTHNGSLSPKIPEVSLSTFSPLSLLSCPGHNTDSLFLLGRFYLSHWEDLRSLSLSQLIWVFLSGFCFGVEFERFCTILMCYFDFFFCITSCYNYSVAFDRSFSLSLSRSWYGFSYLGFVFEMNLNAFILFLFVILIDFLYSNLYNYSVAFELVSNVNTNNPNVCFVIYMGINLWFILNLLWIGWIVW